MSANLTPIFIGNSNFTPTRISGSNTASDGSGNVYTLVTSHSSGSRVDGVRFRNSQASAAASTAMVHRIFYAPDGSAGSGSLRLIGEVATPAATRSTSAVGATSIFTFDYPVLMPSGSFIYVCQSAYVGVQDLTDAVAFAGNFTLL